MKKYVSPFAEIVTLETKDIMITSTTSSQRMLNLLKDALYSFIKEIIFAKEITP